MQPDDDTKEQDLDFSQLDQEVNQLMQQKPDSSMARPEASELNNEPGAEIQDTDTWSAIASQLTTKDKPELEQAEAQLRSASDKPEVESPFKPARPQKSRGFAMDFMHPSQKVAQPKPSKRPKQPQAPQKDLPAGDDYLISANASPDKEPEDEPEKAVSGYGSGGFSVKEAEQIEDKIDQAVTTSNEKKAFEKAINKFEDAPIDVDNLSENTESEPSSETESDNGALPANNLVNKKTDKDYSSQTDRTSSMFDTKEYVQPLKPPIKVKKGNEALWVIVLIVLIIILLCIGGGYYWFILGR